MNAPTAPGTLQRMRAVLASRTLYDLSAQLEWERPVGRPCAHPLYVLLAYGTLARLSRSGIRVQVDLAEPRTWAYARDLMIDALAHHHLDLPPPGPRPPTWDQWRWVRDHHLATEEGLAALARAFPPLAVRCARAIGLLLPDGPGSFTHPHPSRAVYGDGTLVRPLYRTPEAVRIEQDDGTVAVRYVDPRTGELRDTPGGRYDPDLVAGHGQAGPVHGHGYVAFHARGPAPYQRIVLAVAHIPTPGAEAATAVQLIRALHRAAGAGIQAVVYDGAMHGTHIETIMAGCGYLVLAPLPSDDTGTDIEPLALVRTRDGRRARSYPLGVVQHEPAPGTGACVHQLAAVAGAVMEIDLDETGDPVAIGALPRGAVKRSRRATGHYHFNVGYQLPCPAGAFTVWLSPHAAADGDTRRPQNLRIIPRADPDYYRLFRLRGDAENFHTNLKRTLLLDRAMSLGWRRGLVDIYCYALLNNAVTEQRAESVERTGDLSTAHTAARAPRR